MRAIRSLCLLTFFPYYLIINSKQITLKSDFKIGPNQSCLSNSSIKNWEYKILKSIEDIKVLSAL